MSRLIIAIDIDEVLARHNHALASWHNANFGTDHTEEAYFTDYWLQVWNVPAEEAERRAEMFFRQRQHRRFPVIPGAITGVATLAQRYDLVAVTVRRKQIIQDTRDWLNEHFPGAFRDVRFVHFWDAKDTTTKADVCRELGARYLIDDGLKHCALAAEVGIDVLLFGDYTWNRAPALPAGVTRVVNWKEVEEYFSERPII